MEQLQEFLAPIIALLIAGLWAEVRNRVTLKKTHVKIDNDNVNRENFNLWRAAVKLNVYSEFDIIKASLYELVEKHLGARSEEGILTDNIDMRHGVKVPMPLSKRSIQLREGVKTVLENTRATVRHKIISDKLSDMSIEGLNNYTERLSKTVRQTIENDLIKQAYKSPVLEDVLLDFNYSELLDTISGLADHAVRTK